MAQNRPSISDKRRTFRKLHESGCFLIPNPWDLGSARYLQSLGFKALATTSSGSAWSQARSDGGLSRDRVLAHLEQMVAGTDVPINADFENGFAADSGRRRRERAVGRADRCRGLIDRGFDRQRRGTLVRIGRCDRACPRRAPRHRRGGRGHHADRARRMFSGGTRGCGDDDRETSGLCQRGCRLPVRAGHPHDRAHTRRGCRRAPEARQLAGELAG